MAYTLVFFSAAIEFYYKALKEGFDYLLIDRGFNDVAVWADVHIGLGDFNKAQRDGVRECFQPFRKLVDKLIYFHVPVDLALKRHEGTKQEAVDDVAMNRKWLDLLNEAYEKNESDFKNVLKIDGLKSPDVAEKEIWKFVQK